MKAAAPKRRAKKRSTVRHGPEGRSSGPARRRIGYLRAKIVVEQAVDPNTEGEVRTGIRTVELVNRVKPCTVRCDVKLLTGLAIHHKEAFVEVGPHPDELVADVGFQMIPMRRDGISRIVEDDQDAPRRRETPPLPRRRRSS